MDKDFLSNKDVCTVLGLKRSASQKIIQKLNEELELKGFKTVRGRINKRYFAERYFLNVNEIDNSLKVANQIELQPN